MLIVLVQSMFLVKVVTTCLFNWRNVGQEAMSICVENDIIVLICMKCNKLEKSRKREDYISLLLIIFTVWTPFIFYVL